MKPFRSASRQFSPRRARCFQTALEPLESRQVLSSIHSITLLSHETLNATALGHLTQRHPIAGPVAPTSARHAESASVQAVIDSEEAQISIETLPSPAPTRSYAVLIHGLNGQAADLEALGRAIQAVHPETRVYIVDYQVLARAGVAYTNVPNVESNLPDVAREVVAELRSLGIPPQETVLLGYSYGADVARYMTQLGYNATTVGIETAVRFSKSDTLPPLDVNIGAGSLAWDKNAAAKANDYTLKVSSHPPSTRRRHTRTSSMRYAPRSCKATVLFQQRSMRSSGSWM